MLATTTDSDPFKRRTAIEAIGKLPQDAKLTQVVLSALSDSSGYVARTAMEISGRWKLAEAHERIASRLKDADPLTRAACLRALTSIGIEGDVEPVLNMFRRDPNRDVRAAAGWCLRALAGQDTWSDVFDAFHIDSMPRHRRFACELAVRFDGRSKLAEIDSLTRDADGHVRGAAEGALSSLSDS
ncbi:HEAT repeat domain-containing protein [Devosia sp.]|uniref:HEAT repeat domain-containing protein n=1 Tax=Devosia sp. TaxID=1871048 RepID=UPI003A94C5ED